MTGEEQQLPSTEELAEISATVAAWQQATSELEQANRRVKELTATLEKLETDVLPGLMATAGNISQFKLVDGPSIRLKDELYAHISAANKVAAFAWLEQHGHGGVIKDSLAVTLGKGAKAAERAAAIIAKLEELGVDDYSRKLAVHPQTLQALLREQLAEGVDVPKDIFGVHQVRRAVIEL